MKKKLLIILSIATFIVLGLLFSAKITSESKMDKLRKQHMAFLQNSPFNKTLQLSKEERLAKGLPPNKYYEQMWNLTMDPNDGKPHPERLFELQERLKTSRVPGENTNSWVERGPNNVGGRTRAVMFDPNDATNKRVFAGGVSGGLWVNNDITNSNSTWTEVGIPKNLAVSSITYDPNNTSIFYVGTGESYVAGQVNGNGLWKSVNGGATWSKVFGGITGTTTFESNAILTVNSPAGITGDYAAILTTAFGTGLGTPVTGNLILVNDGVGTTDDGCETLTNGAAISGNIAVVRRGSCNFTAKVQNAETAGAIAVIVVNNIAGSPIPMGAGTNPPAIGIPSIMISKNDGNNIIAQLGSGVNATMKLSNSGFVGNFVTPGIQHINDVVVKNNGGVSEVYVVAGESFYGDSSPSSLLGTQNYGLFKSTNNGASWTEVTLPLTAGGNKYVPNDIEIGADGTIWVATTESLIGGDGGGTILSSGNGTSFVVKHTIANAKRTQIAVSSTNSNVIFVLAQLTSGANSVGIYRTNDQFTNVTSLVIPNDADTGIPATDFTRGQAFYDLMLEVDPSNDNIIYVGGIDLFRSTNSGGNWTQISKWSNNNNLAGLNIPLVHADQHAMAFNPANSNQAVFGCDGGVYYANTLSGASSSTTAISSRNKGYNTVQFYKGAIGSETSSEKLLAGAQDNGSNLINNAVAGVNSSTEVTGGDGAYVFIDKDNGYMVSSYVYNVYYNLNYATGGLNYFISSDQSTGSFINPAALDSQNNILYTNGSTGGTSPTYQVFKYSLNNNSATKTTITDALLTSTPTALKANTTAVYIGTETGQLLKIDYPLFLGTWSNVTGPDFYGSISCIELGATDSDVYVTFYNYGVTNIFYSNDGGTTWQNKEGNFPDIPVRAIMSNPLNANEVIIGTDLGVWATPNFNSANPNWYQSQNGMKDVVVTSFDLRSADNVVLASTYGRGMFTGQFTAAQSGLSVDNFTQNDLIKIYPTVSDGNIMIKTISDARKGNLSIFDINGRNVYSSKINFDSGIEKPISLNLSSGMYIAKFESEGLQSSQKIIIK